MWQPFIIININFNCKSLPISFMLMNNKLILKFLTWLHEKISLKNTSYFDNIFKLDDICQFLWTSQAKKLRKPIKTSISFFKSYWNWHRSTIKTSIYLKRSLNIAVQKVVHRHFKNIYKWIILLNFVGSLLKTDLCYEYLISNIININR